MVRGERGWRDHLRKVLGVVGASHHQGEDAVRMGEDETETPGGGDGVLLTDDEGGTWLNDWLLSTVDSWVLSGRSKEDVVGKVMTSFDLKDLRAAARRLQKGKWVSPNFTIMGEGSADYSRQLAGVVYDALVSIQNKDPVAVKFCVSSADLSRVPGAQFDDNLDEPAVSARLGSVDARLVEILERLVRTEQLSGTVAGLATTVTKLQDQLREQQLAAKAVQPQAASWAQTVGMNLTKERGRLSRLRSERSTSRKRQGDEMFGTGSKQQRVVGSQVGREVDAAIALRQTHPAPPGSILSQDLATEKEFQQVVRKRRGSGVKKGSSQVQADGAEAAPFSVFISGTSPACKVETVKEKLIQCAAAVRTEQPESEEKELEILKVEEILLKIPQGEVRRSRCWKVTVPPEFAEHMMTSKAYPAAWGFRKWQRGPSRPPLPPTQENVNGGDGGA